MYLALPALPHYPPLLDTSTNDNPVFILISEMRRPQDAKRAAWTLQIFATSFYTIFAAIMYAYLGPNVASPAFSSLPPKWAKAAYGIALPSFLIAGSLYAHTAAKLFFVRIFRRRARSRHLHHHTPLGWAVWTALVLVVNSAAFVLAVGVPIFAYLVSIAASLFASWYTYGIAGAFWLFDAWHDHGRWAAYRRWWGKCAVNVATLLAGGFICVAGECLFLEQCFGLVLLGGWLKATMDMDIKTDCAPCRHVYQR